MHSEKRWPNMNKNRFGITISAFGVLTLIACSSSCSTESATGGATQLPFTGIASHETQVFLAMDAQGNGTTVWRDGDARFWWTRVLRGSGLTDSAVLAETQSQTGSFVADRDGNLTFILTRNGASVFRRYVPNQSWSDLPSPGSTLGWLDAGPGGQLITVFGATDDAQKKRLVVQRYGPSSGWSAPDTLAEIAETNVIGLDAAIYADGSALVTWTSTQGAIPQAYERFVPGTGWTGVKTTDILGGTSHLLSNDQGGAMLLTFSSDANQQPTHTLTSRSFGPEGLGAAQTVALDSTQFYASAMGKNGAAIVAWKGPVGVRAHYFSPSGGWTSIDVPGSDSAGSAGPPLVGIDAQGRAVVAWGAGVGARGYNAHVFSARYAPASGWTSSTQVDSDGAAFYGPLLVNDAGDAMLGWSQDASDTANGTHWVKLLP